MQCVKAQREVEVHDSFARAVDRRVQALDANHGLEFVEHIYAVPPDKVHEFVGGMQEATPTGATRTGALSASPRWGRLSSSCEPGQYR